VEQPHEPSQSTLTPSPRENDKPAADPSQSRLPVYVLIFLLVVAVVAGFLWYDVRAAYHDALNYWDSNLSISVDQQINVGNLWLTERRTDTEAIARNTATIRLLSSPDSSGNIADIRQEVERAIDKMARINGFVGGAVADTGCRIVAQTGVPPQAKEDIQSACREAQASGKITIVAAYRRAPHVWLIMALPVSAAAGASPAAQPSRHWCGAAIMLAEPWRTVFRTLGEESLSNRSAETEIIWREEGDAVSFSPRVSYEGVESVFRLPLSGNAFEPRAAREGKIGFGDFIDYRGKNVFAVARPIPLAGASLARKVDRDQALSEFHKRVLLEWLAGALFVLLFGSVIAAQHRHLMMRDLQEKLKQQEALQKSERRYRILFESAGDAIFLMRGGTFIDCNQKALEMYRCTRDDIIGLSISARDPRSPPDGPNPRLAALEKVRQARDGQTLHFEWQARRLDETTFDAEISMSRLGIEGDVLLLAVVRDVTDRKRAEKALAESRALLDSIVNGTSDLIWSVDAKSLRLLSFNQSFVDFFLQRLGIRAKEGMLPEDLLPTDDLKKRWYEFYQRALREGSYTIEYDMQTAPRTLQLSFNVLTRAGVVFAVSVFAKDITERRRAQEDRQRSFEQLRALAARLQVVREEERKRLAREIHDQLGQALTAIKMDLSSLVRGLPAGQSPLLEKGTPLLHLVDETIENVRRISSELRPGMLDDLGLAATVEWAAEEFAARTGTKCLLDLAAEQTAVDSETGTAVFRIFQETLTNVARHANASEVSVRLAEEGGDLTLVVQDNGKGINKDELASASSLGILGMRERALLLGGTLTISGEPGRGTTVRLRIPEVRRT